MNQQVHISIQGQKHSYHDIAASYFFNDSYSRKQRTSFKEVFQDVTEDRVKYGIVAIENSIYGSINTVYDLLLQHQVAICGEIYLKIQHMLITKDAADISSIRQVYSHPVALAQCEDFLQKELPSTKRFEAEDTAGAVKYLSLDPLHTAIIASEKVANAQHLKILKRNIETHHQNYTRFIVFTKTRQTYENLNNKNIKSSIVLQLNDEPGSLARALTHFADANINLTKIESRPIIGKIWSYVFYIDFEGDHTDVHIATCLSKIQKLGSIKILGSYKKGVYYE
jgi:prephenate dehydratase